MPEIDVSEVLLSSEIAGEIFTYTRRPETVTQQGRSTAAAQRFQGYGAIAPATPDDIIRLEDFDAQSKAIAVITNVKLRGVSRDAAGQNYKPDLVTWKGNDFQVTIVEDWSQYGAGFVRVVCVSRNFVDQAPSDPT